LNNYSQRTQVISFGGGVNSTAMCLGLYERNETIKYILFSDTGGERPETYRHVEEFSAWLVAHGLPEIITVRHDSETLEEFCLRYKTLPSIVLGVRQCSVSFKRMPQDRWFSRQKMPSDYLRLIGFDAGEPHRVKDYPNTRYPLIEWNWTRTECLASFQRHGIKPPTKSMCFFCPMMKRHQIIELKTEHPDLFDRAVAMEHNNQRIRVAGLSREKSWEEIIKLDESQAKLFGRSLPCECYDGSDETEENS
jgi:hypothetical protein